MPFFFQQSNSSQIHTHFHRLSVAFKTMLSPLLLVVLVGGTFRNSAGIILAYNMAPYFEHKHPNVRVRYQVLNN